MKKQAFMMMTEGVIVRGTVCGECGVARLRHRRAVEVGDKPEIMIMPWFCHRIERQHYTTTLPKVECIQIEHLTVCR